MRNSIKLAHIYSLLLSTDSIYFKAQYPGRKTKQWVKGDLKKVFGVNYSDVENYALSKNHTKINEKLGQTIKDYTDAFILKIKNKLDDQCRNEYKEIYRKLIELPRLERTDFYNNAQLGTGDAIVHRVGEKLGLSKAQVYAIIDRARNTRPKTNCGIFLESAKAKDCFDKARGVYLVVLPNVIDRDGSFKACTLRVSNVLQHDGKDEQSPYWIRAKLNLPNYHTPHVYQLRYQYRGYLTPSNNDYCWSFNMAQAPYSIDREDAQNTPLPGSLTERDNSGEISSNLSDHLTLLIQNPNRNRVNTGLLSSLSQRKDPNDPGIFRIPYSAKAIVVCIYSEDFSDREIKFMKRGVGFFQDKSEALKHFKENVGIKDENILERIESCLDLYLKYFGENPELAIQIPQKLSEEENALFNTKI